MFFAFAVLLFLASCATTQQDPAHKLLGKHGLSLQWIGWEPDELGTMVVQRDEQKMLTISGQQKGENGDYLTIEGFVTEVEARAFTFQGTIVTKVSHIAKGRAVVREGRQRFVIYGERDYWRMENLNNPEDGVVDYIDVHF